MNVSEVVKEIKSIDLFKDIVFSEPSKVTDSQFGVISVEPRHFKDSNKNEIKLGSSYNLFIAHMYKDRTDMEEFFYLTFDRKGEQRDYRRRSFYSIEYNKIFASGDSVNQIISNLKEQLIGYQLK